MYRKALGMTHPLTEEVTVGHWRQIASFYYYYRVGLRLRRGRRVAPPGVPYTVPHHNTTSYVIHVVSETLMETCIIILVS